MTLQDLEKQFDEKFPIILTQTYTKDSAIFCEVCDRGLSPIYDKAQIKAFLKTVWEAREDNIIKVLSDKADKEIEFARDSLRQELREKIEGMIDVYIKNCETAIKEGGMSQFGSASGGMMADSALKAFQSLKDQVLKLLR